MEGPETPSPIRRSNRVAIRKNEIEKAKKHLLNNHELDLTPPKPQIEKNFPIFERKKKHIIVNDTRAQLELASRQYDPKLSSGKESPMFISQPKPTFSLKKNTSPQKSHTVTSSCTTSRNKQLFNCKPNNNNVSPILPSLTDDMFVMEAPSFIIPYIYVKPPKNTLKEFLGQKLSKKLGEKRKIDEKGTDKFLDDGCSPPKKTQDKNEITSETKIDSNKPVEIENHSMQKPISKSQSPFDTTLGKFFVNIGGNLVKEFVQRDLLNVERINLAKKKKKARNGILLRIAFLRNNIELSEKVNFGLSKHINFEIKNCKICSFKTESALVLEHHMVTPHMKNDIYKCNFCDFETKSPHDVLYHVELEHNIMARLERAPAFYQCHNCVFDDIVKTKLARHLSVCVRKFQPEFNLSPGNDWEFPAKISLRTPIKNHLTSIHKGQFFSPMVSSAFNRTPTFNRPPTLNGTAPFNMPLTFNRPPTLNGPPTFNGTPTCNGTATFNRPLTFERPSTFNRPPTFNRPSTFNRPLTPKLPLAVHNRSRPIFNPPIPVPNLVKKPVAKVTSQSLSSKPVPEYAQAKVTTYQPQGPFNSDYDKHSKSAQAARFLKKYLQPSIICEICDSHLKDMKNLRIHMKLFHQITLLERFSARRPPLNCQKCTSRFFTDQGLERHLLGIHGLITPAMEQAAQNNRDCGICLICGKKYIWKLVAHVKTDHNKIIKPAHLSYRCTVCTKSFAFYKDLETHVMTTHDSSSMLDKGVSQKPALNIEATMQKLNLGEISLTKL